MSSLFEKRTMLTVRQGKFGMQMSGSSNTSYVEVIAKINNGLKL